MIKKQLRGLKRTKKNKNNETIQQKIVKSMVGKNKAKEDQSWA